MIQPLRILLIEDNPDDRLLIVRGLKKGFERLSIEEINSQKDLDLAIHKGEFDLAITDYDLGWSDGITVYHTIKQCLPACPVILMTVLDTEQFGKDTMTAGLDRYVIKSASQFVRLPDIVRSVLDEQERKTALEQSELLNKTIIESVREAVVVFDRGLLCVVWNTFMEEITGIPPQEALGKPAAEVFPQIEAGEAPPLLQRVLQGETIDISDIPYLNPKTGKTGWVEGWYGPLTTGQGEIIGVVATLHEITERKQAESEREKLLQTEKERAMELAALTTAATTISSSLEINLVMNVVAEQMARLLNVNQCTISLWDRTTDSLSLFAEYPVASKTSDTPLSELSPSSFITKIIKGGALLQINREDKSIPKKHKAYLEEKNSQSILISPLLVQDTPIGYAELLDHEKARTFTPQEINLVQMLGNQAAVALENARLFEATRRQLLELTTLNQISTFAAGTTDEDAYIEFVTKLISETFYPFNFGILLLDRTENILRPHRSYIKTRKVEKDVHIPLGEGITGMVAKTGKTAIVPDVAEFQDYLSYDGSTRSEICVPMKIDEKIIGVINAEHPQPNAFDQADERLLNTLANQISITLERFRTNLLETRHARHLNILNQLGGQITGVLNRRQLCDLITQGLVTNFGYYTCGILILSEDGEILNLESVAGKDAHIFVPGVYRQSIYTGLIGKAVRERRIVVENDVSQSKDFYTVEKTQAQAELVLPLIVEDRVIGALVIDSDQRDAFGKSDISTLSSLADQLATGLEKVRLFDKTAETLRREQKVNEIVRRLSQGLDEETISADIVRLACEAVGAESGAFGILTADGQTIDFRFVYNPVEEYAEISARKGEGLGWAIVETGQSILLEDYRSHEKAFTGKKAGQTRAFIGVPVTTAEVVIGVLMVYNYSPDKKFTQRDLTLVESIGRQAGIAIQNAQLFQETREALVRERVLNEITHAVSSALDLDTIIQKVTELSALLVSGDASILSLADPITKSPNKINYYNAPSGAPQNPLPEFSGLMSGVLQEGRSVLLSDYADHPKALDFWVNAGMRGFLVVPLLAGETTIGALAVFSQIEGYFNQRDLDLLQSVAQQTGIAIQKALLFEETTRRSSELSALYDIAVSTSSMLDTTTLLQQLHNKVKHLIQPDCFGVFLYDNETREFEVVMALDYDHVIEENIGARFPLEDGGLIGWVMQQRQTLSIGDIERDPLPANPTQLSLPTRSWLGVPLTARDRLIGALSIQSYQPGIFDQEHIRFLESLARQVATALDNARLYEELEDAFVQTVVALANAMDVRDTYTHDHSQRIAVWAEETGRMLGCSGPELEIIHWAALLHDIGKIGVPDEILLKPASLTEQEYEIIKRHPVLGASIIAPVKKLKDVAPIIHHHQEKFDGTGYPDGLKGDQIPLAARILSVVDSYIAITDDRVYRKAQSKKRAVREIKSLAGTHYDPEVVEAFLHVLENQRKSSK